MKWLLIALVSLLQAASVFGLGLVGYFAYGNETDWYMPLSLVAALAIFAFALWENVSREREWERA